MKHVINFQIAVVLFLLMVVPGNAQGPTPGTWLYDQNENKVDDRLEEIAATFPDSLIGMIVDFRYHPEENDADFLRNFGEINYVMQYLPSISIRNAQAEVAFTIAEDMNVVMVEWDEIVHATVPTSVRALRARPSNQYSPNTAWEAGFRGHGVNIAILDTGVDDGHPSLNDMDDNPATTDPKFVAGYDATATPRTAANPDDDNAYDPYHNPAAIFHGTHVAGIALGTGGGSDSAGVAPEAKLIDVKVLDEDGNGTFSDVIAGVEWCIKNRNTAWSGQPSAYHGIDVLNMSLAGSTSDGQDALCRTVNEAVKMGIVVVVAVGNNNLTNFICTPAAADGAIAVGSVNDMGTINRNDDTISSHAGWGSNRGPRTSDGDSDQMDELKPDVTAYGSFIGSAKGIDPGQSGSGYHDLSGTSQATPHVSGTCALILQAHPQFQPHDVKNVLRATAEDKNGTYNSSLDPHYDVDYGWGIVNAFDAVTATNIPPDLWISRKPVWWSSEDIWLANPPAVGVANTIYARIHNTSGTAASGVTVRFQVGVFGTGQPKWLWTQTTTISVTGTGTQTASVPWTPTAATLAKGPDHPCIRVEIIYNQDPNSTNNMAQKNLKLQGATGASAFSFRAWNPVDAPKKTFFGLDKFDLPEGWHAYFEPDDIFEMDYADSVDLFAEIFVSPTAALGYTTSVHIAEFFRGTIAPIGGVTLSLVIEPAPAKIVLPDTSGVHRDTLMIPIIVSTDSAIGLAQFVVDFDSTVADFIGAQVGPNASNFTIEIQPDLPFPPSTFPATNKNILIQISGGGSRFFTGQNQQVALLGFTVVDSVVEHATPLIFDRGIEKTFLTTERLHDIRGEELAIFDGRIGVREAGWPVTVMVKYDLIDPPRPVEGVLVTLNHSEGTVFNTTGIDGMCQFPDVPEGAVSISLSKIGDHRGAITGADALLTLRYLAFLEQLSDPQMIAADVVMDNVITGADALAILRHLAFFPSEIDCTGGWWATPITLPAPQNYVDASAYLLGDVTLNWGEGQAALADDEHIVSSAYKQDPASKLLLSLGKLEGIPGKTILVPITIQTYGKVGNTLIFTVEYDPSCLEYQSTLKTELTKHFMIAANGTDKGKVHVAIAGVPGIQKSGEILQLAFKVIENTIEEKSELTFSRAVVNDLKAINYSSGCINFAKSETEVPRTFQLAQNYPNPFNAETIIRYGIPDTKNKQVHVTVNIYNISGRLVRTLVDEKKAPGYYTIAWDGTDNKHRQVASGIYFYQIRASEFSSIKKLAVLK